jgi:hypothetical protein
LPIPEQAIDVELMYVVAEAMILPLQVGDFSSLRNRWLAPPSAECSELSLLALSRIYLHQFLLSVCMMLVTTSARRGAGQMRIKLQNGKLLVALGRGVQVAVSGPLYYPSSSAPVLATCTSAMGGHPFLAGLRQVIVGDRGGARGSCDELISLSWAHHLDVQIVRVDLQETRGWRAVGADPVAQSGRSYHYLPPSVGRRQTEAAINHGCIGVEEYFGTGSGSFDKRKQD